MELKPCPFCGGEAIVKQIELTRKVANEVSKDNWKLFHSYTTKHYKNGKIGKVFIYDVLLYEPICENKLCPCYHGNKYDSISEAIEAWNRRSEDG